MTGSEAVDVFEEDVDDVVLVGLGLSAGVGGEDHIVHVPQGTIVGEGFLFDDVQARTSDYAAVQGVHQGPFVDASASGHVDKAGGGLHAGEGAGVDEAAGLVVQGTG